MTTVITDCPHDAIASDALDQFTAEINIAHPTAACTGITLNPETDAAGNPDPTRDRVIVQVDGTLSLEQLDAVVAAHPTIAPGVTGTFAATINTQYKICEVPLVIGDHVVLDVHIHAALGNLASADASYIDYYVAAWRDGAGNVQIEDGAQPTIGRIPGISVSTDSTASTIRVFLSMRKSGTLTIFQNTVEVISRGRLS